LLRLFLGAVVVSDLDEFHPNNEGEREIARLFFESLYPSYESGEFRLAVVNSTFVQAGGEWKSWP
jgi:hypothetical protein